MIKCDICNEDASHFWKKSADNCDNCCTGVVAECDKHCIVFSRNAYHHMKNHNNCWIQLCKEEYMLYKIVDI